jgi:hypothetical protein
MKKLVSILLALVMVLGLAVTSFATVVLEPVKPEVEELMELPQLVFDDKNESVFTAGEGGTYYVMLDPAIEYKNLTVTGSGCVAAKVFKYDPEKHAALEGITYCVKKGDTVVEGGLDYYVAKEKVKELNNAEKTTQYKMDADGCYVNIIEIKVEDNYTAAYKEGKVVIKALNVGTGKSESATIKVVSDVTIFEYEQIKWAAANKDTALECGDNGYSDYETVDKGYGDKDYDHNDLRTVPNATVVPTTAFRAIEGKDLKVETAGMTVKVKNVAAGQKGVNFAAYPLREVDTNKDGKIEEVVFGFYGKQTLASKFEVTIDTGYTWYTLREAFGIKLEENNVVTYVVYKDGQPYASFEVDYADAEQARSSVKLVIDGAAGTTLGEYSIQVGEAEHVVEDEVVEESNPNTGAPSFLEWLWMLIFS